MSIAATLRQAGGCRATKDTLAREERTCIQTCAIRISSEISSLTVPSPVPSILSTGSSSILPCLFATRRVLEELGEPEAKSR
jgi:hypothetical protein